VNDFEPHIRNQGRLATPNEALCSRSSASAAAAQNVKGYADLIEPSQFDWGEANNDSYKSPVASALRSVKGICTWRSCDSCS